MIKSEKKQMAFIESEQREGYVHVAMCGEDTQIEEMWENITKHILNVGQMTEAQMITIICRLEGKQGETERLREENEQLKRELREATGCDTCAHLDDSILSGNQEDCDGVCEECKMECVCRGCDYQSNWEWERADGNQH